MSDALISPVVGALMWGVSAGSIVYVSKKLDKDIQETKIPVMGALGAFVFAAQMINFAIPLTGSSGHLSGGILLCAILGSHAAFLTMASILFVQALFFADGGLLALGCNIFNMGFLPCYIAYPLVYKNIVGTNFKSRKLFWGCLLASVLALQLGAFGVVMQVMASGITDLPAKTFFLFMQPIHLAIGIVEGFITAAVVGYLLAQKPELLTNKQAISYKKISIIVFAQAILIAAFISFWASGQPDGLEWSVMNTSGKEELLAMEGFWHNYLATMQEKLAIFPDYQVGSSFLSTSLAGLIGIICSFVFVFALGKVTRVAYDRKR